MLAHEVGHSLGLKHDEDKSCGSNYIMSETLGFGKTKFSMCTAKAFQKRFNQVFDHDQVEFHKMAQCYQYSSYPNPVAVFSDKR